MNILFLLLSWRESNTIWNIFSNRLFWWCEERKKWYKSFFSLFVNLTFASIKFPNTHWQFCPPPAVTTHVTHMIQYRAASKLQIFHKKNS
jgi:hypothetical protein